MTGTVEKDAIAQFNTENPSIKKFELLKQGKEKEQEKKRYGKNEEWNKLICFKESGQRRKKLIKKFKRIPRRFEVQSETQVQIKNLTFFISFVKSYLFNCPLKSESGIKKSKTLN